MSNKIKFDINIIWYLIVAVSVLTASYCGNMKVITDSIFASAKSAVTLSIGLIGPMALWLGIMKVAEDGGLMVFISRLVRPVMIRLFPSVPSEHPAMSAMVMNISANALGLGNAATPFGIKAMKELDTLNKKKGVATNAMALFLAINTSSVTLLPLGVITVRASAGAHSPAAILIPSIFATAVSTTVAIIIAKSLERFYPESLPESSNVNSKTSSDEHIKEDDNKIDRFKLITIVGIIVAFIGGLVYRFSINGFPSLFSPEFFTTLSNWLIPTLVITLISYGFFKGVKVYESLTEGAKEGFSTAVRIVPFMVAMFVAIGMFRASGALDIMIKYLSPLTSLIGMPAEALPMALMRPLSGSGAFGIMAEIVQNNPDSFLSYLVSTMQGSTETTFYVMAVYFGSVGIKDAKHAIVAALSADLAGILASVFICRIMY